MARVAHRLAGNAPGRFFVDDSCIDCDACRQLAPRVFARAGDQSIVVAQPDDGDAAATERALMALVACPTASIGAQPLAKAGAARAAAARFPERIGDGDIYYCGYHSADSYGAASYLIVRARGNVLVDSPRAARPLMARLAALGGVAQLVLTHRDDVADHEQLARRFGCRRVMHAADAGRLSIEQRVDGADPIPLADDLLLIPVPGHTRGSLALLHDGVLFTGDHVWWDDELGRLDAGRDVCWYSWTEQLQSLKRLLQYSFHTILPGHGRRFHAESPAAMRVELERLLHAL